MWADTLQVGTSDSWRTSRHPSHALRRGAVVLSIAALGMLSLRLLGVPRRWRPGHGWVARRARQREPMDFGLDFDSAVASY